MRSNHVCDWLSLLFVYLIKIRLSGVYRVTGPISPNKFTVPSEDVDNITNSFDGNASAPAQCLRSMRGIKYENSSLSPRMVQNV